VGADYQYIDPAESGAVIPILHANGYKIGERTITGAMDNLEVSSQRLTMQVGR
jgi:xylulose-5-phosphate/fructose-6-phosphate phosphoketolase